MYSPVLIPNSDDGQRQRIPLSSISQHGSPTRFPLTSAFTTLTGKSACCTGPVHIASILAGFARPECFSTVAPQNSYHIQMYPFQCILMRWSSACAVGGDLVRILHGPNDTPVIFSRGNHHASSDGVVDQTCFCSSRDRKEIFRMDSGRRCAVRIHQCKMVRLLSTRCSLLSRASVPRPAPHDFRAANVLIISMNSQSASHNFSTPLKAESSLPT